MKPTGYASLLDMKQTEQGIKLIKEFFQQNLSTELRLRRVTAPLFVLQGLGLNDDLNGVEQPVTFAVKDMGGAKAEVVHSLAKWKRMSLAEYGVAAGYGIYTDMNAIRTDEELDNLHSLYVDQWDWEAVIRPEDRTVAFLNSTAWPDLPPKRHRRDGPCVRPRGQIACGRTQGPSLPNVRMNPTERSPLSWILKNREKQEKQEKGFYLYFLFLSVFLTRNTSAAPQSDRAG